MAAASALGQRDVLLALDAAADRDDPLRLRQVDRLPRLLERRFGLLSNARPIDVGLDDAHRRGTTGCLVGAKCTDLEAHQVRCLTLRDDVGCQLALKHRAGERAAAGVFADAGAVGDQRSIEACGQRRREIPGLVRVRQQHQRGRGLLHERVQGLHEAVGGVGLERGMLQQDDLRDRGGATALPPRRSRRRRARRR